MKYVIITTMVVVLSGVVYYFIVSNAAPLPVTTIPEDTVPVSPLRVEPNAVVVVGQQPDRSVSVSMVQLEAPGFVVIHEDAGGQVGAVLGASSILAAGQNLNINVALPTSTTDGQKLHAVLHSDSNNNAKFDVGTDATIQDSRGNTLDGWFDISTSSATGTPITI